MQIDKAGTRAFLVFGFPFYLKTAAEAAYNKMDVSLLGMRTNNLEVGWYGAASQLASLALLAAPLMGWVLMPLFARALARSRDALEQAAHRSMELILALSIPLSLGIALGADVWIRWVFGASFAPSVLALQLLAPVFVVTYVSMICSMQLALLNRGWALTGIAAAGFAVNFGLNMVLVPLSMRLVGPGGGGPACALSLLGTELVVTGAMLALMGGRGFDRRTWVLVAKCGGASLFAVAVDHALRPWGAARLGVDAAVYVMTVLLTRAVLPRMRSRGFGRIVNIGSIHALVASPFKSAYVAAKHGLLGLSKVVALESAGADVAAEVEAEPVPPTAPPDRASSDG